MALAGVVGVWCLARRSTAKTNFKKWWIICMDRSVPGGRFYQGLGGKDGGDQQGKTAADARDPCSLSRFEAEDFAPILGTWHLFRGSINCCT